MLNVPNQIIALCKADSTRKNFRVHFPNGENSDLTNADIVAGTVQFTESVSSKDVLQFGLAEASRIQFECVNVQNIYGMTIECGIEIDTSSLTPADISSIQSNQGDGTLVLESASDIGYGYYRIPYGVFTVTSCPRSAGAMWRRRVEAYTPSTQGETFINDALAYRAWSPQLSINQIVLGICAGNDDMGLLTEDGTISPTIEQAYGASDAWIYEGSYYQMVVDSYNSDEYRFTNPSFEMLRITNNFDSSIIAPIFDEMKAYGADDDAIAEAQKYFYPNYSFQVTGRPPETHRFRNLNDSGYIPYISVYILTVDIPRNVIYQLYKDNVLIKSYTYSNLCTSVTATKYILTDSILDSVIGTYEKTANNPSQPGLGTYIDAVDLPKIYEGTLELIGKFGRSGRNGESTSVGLSKANPISMSTDEYMDLWWDEFDISPIGSVKLTYMDIDLNAEQTIIYTFGNGQSQYDMTDNYLLKNLGVSVNDLTGQTVEQFVTSLLDAVFIPNIADIAFTPVQLQSLGLPYLEAGDYLEIDDGNNGTVETYILNRTISGEQFLRDDIESKGGEIIGNVRSV